MIYYLEDYVTKCIVLISEDIFLVNNVRSGILDCRVKTTHFEQAAKTIDIHLNTNQELGITLNWDTPKVVSLKNFDTVKEKIRLANLRKPLFQELLDSFRKYTTNNLIGFSTGDEFYIQYALTNKHALKEYAEMTGMSAEFAEKELTILSESALRDNFRAFTVATVLKNKINQITDKEQIEDIIDLIRKSFAVAGNLNG